MAGFIGLLKGFSRTGRERSRVSDVKYDPGGGAIQEAQNFGPAGEDTHPLPTDYVAAVQVRGTDKYVVVGYVDPLNDQTAAAGERRIYSRNVNGDIVATVHLRNDGSVTCFNAAGVLTLEAGGDVVGNGARMTTDGDVVTSDGISLRNHTHAQGPDSAGNSQAETDAPT